MNELPKERLIGLLSEPSQVTNDEMQSAYESFMTNVLTANQPEMDCETAFRLLSMTRIEFKTLHAQALYEQGEKCA